MIVSFADKTTEDVFHGSDSKEARKVPKALWPLARRKLDMLDAAVGLQDLRVPPGNRLEKLVGDRARQHSIRVNDQFRVCFVFRDGNAHDVSLCDYH